MRVVMFSSAQMPTCLLAVLLAGSFGCSRTPTPAAAGPPPVPVLAAKARIQSVPVELHVVGSVQPFESVQVKSRVAGELLRVHFQEGSVVAVGALLFAIDPRPFEESLRLAEANVARDRALLNQAQATLARDLAQAENAEADSRRYAQLATEGVISRERQDQTQTAAAVARESARASEAAIESAKASLQADIAALETARLNLSYCHIYAPIAGRTGNLLVNAGNLIQANSQALVVIHKISPIFVQFSVPEQHLATIRRQVGKQNPSVIVSSKDNPTLRAEGRLSLINNEVDTTTGTVLLKAVFSNRDGDLWPGQFVDVSMHLSTIADATVVPSEAVQTGQSGRFVYIIKEDATVEPRPVETGESFDGGMVVSAGISPGETVVTDGHLRLYPGAKVQQTSAEVLDRNNAAVPPSKTGAP